MPIDVENLTKTFGQVPVLSAITERFADWEVSVLLGTSGCGKTTTLRGIAGLERPSGGRIAINGQAMYSDRPQVFVPVDRRRIAMVFQSYAIWPHMTVFQNVSLPLRALSGGQSSEKSMMHWIWSTFAQWDCTAQHSCLAANSSGWRSPVASYRARR